MNANGTGADSPQVTAKPQNYQLVTQVNAVASSQISGWPPSNAIDGSFVTNYSSQPHTSATATEWIYVDAGVSSAIGRLVIGYRQRDGQAAPTLDNNLHTQIQVSTDGSTWFSVDYRLNKYNIIDDDGLEKTIVDFNQPLYGRYVRLYSTSLNSDIYNYFYLQVGEIQTYSVPMSAIASSYQTGWEPWRILDTDLNTVYSSNAGDSTPWIGINLGSVQQIAGLNLTPRAAGSCFPVSFVLQSSNDGVNWTAIPGQSYTNYANPGSNVVSFSFSSPVTAQYVRVYTTQMGKDSNGSLFLQMAQITINQTVQFTATASSQLTGWAASNVTDDNPATAWSSAGHAAANSTEWIELDMGSSHRVQDLRLVPRGGCCFPTAFAITYSADNITWHQVPGQTYTSFVNPASVGTTPNPVELFFFSTPVTARYFKITATQLTADSFGSYYFQLGDVLIDQNSSY